MNTINFPAPLTVALKSLTVSSLRYTVSDDGAQAIARFAGIPGALVLWGTQTTPPYSVVGDYTQAQIDARVQELLGVNPAEVLSGLVPPNLA